MFEIWAEYSRFDTTSQKLSDQARMILKSWFSDLKMLQICGHINREEY